ncbi:MAG: hypothetical protein KJ579_10905 [Verrucomicrobia bacterium]|nr:hypothetical protein [Verrucomicrobiota bacterium]
MTRMPTRWTGLAAALGISALALAWPAPAAQAASTAHIRLIAASGGPAKVDPGLRDVEPLLKRNLNFTQLRLLDSGSVKLPTTGAAVSLKAGVTVRCNGSADKLAITVESGGRVVAQTQVAMRPNIPLILSGFPGGGGTMMVIVQLR